MLLVNRTLDRLVESLPKSLSFCLLEDTVGESLRRDSCSSLGWVDFRHGPIILLASSMDKNS